MLELMGQSRRSAAVPLKNEPPATVFSRTPVILVSVDGASVCRAVAGTQWERVVNNRPLPVRRPAGKHYLRVFDGWLESRSLAGKYAISKKPPKDLEKVLRQAVESRRADLLDGAAGPARHGAGVAPTGIDVAGGSGPAPAAPAHCPARAPGDAATRSLQARRPVLGGLRRARARPGRLRAVPRPRLRYGRLRRKL